MTALKINYFIILSQESVNKSFERKLGISSYLQWRLLKSSMRDLPCYASPAVQDEFRKKILKSSCYGNIEIVKILAPMTNNPNYPNMWRDTPINLVAFHGHTEIVKFLAPLTDNPSAPR